MNTYLKTTLLLLCFGFCAAFVGTPIKQWAYPQNTLNSGSAEYWYQRITNAGGTVSSASYTAVQGLQRCVVDFGLLPKLFYLNPRVGNSLAAANTPLIDKFGYGGDLTVSGSGFNEAVGLSNVTVDTGIDPYRAGVTYYGFSYGLYALSDAVSDIGSMLGSDAGPYGLDPRIGDNMADYWYGAQPGVAIGSIKVTDGAAVSTWPTQGLIAATRSVAGAARLFRNGALLGYSTTLPTSPLGGYAVGSIPTMKIITTDIISGGEFIGWGMDRDDILTMGWCFQNMNAALAVPRAVYPDGMYHP